VSAIFGAVDYTKDMRVKLTSAAEEQKSPRHMAVAARAASVVAIDAPSSPTRTWKPSRQISFDGRQMGYEGRMIIHPSQIEVCNRFTRPIPTT